MTLMVSTFFTEEVRGVGQESQLFAGLQPAGSLEYRWRAAFLDHSGDPTASRTLAPLLQMSHVR